MSNKMITVCNNLWANKRQFKLQHVHDTLKDIAGFYSRNKTPTTCEVLKGDPVDTSSSNAFDRHLTVTKPFFDYDKTLELEAVADEHKLAEVLEQEKQTVTEAVHCIIRQVIPFSDCYYKINVAQRSGVVKNKTNDRDVYKVSQWSLHVKLFTN